MIQSGNGLGKDQGKFYSGEWSQPPNTMPSVTRVWGYMPRAALPINRSRVSDSMWWRTPEPNRLRFCLPEAELSAKLPQSTGWTPRLEMRNSKIMRSVVGGREAGRQNCRRICSLPDCSLSVLSPCSLSLPKEMKGFYRTHSLAKSEALQVAQTRKRIHSSAMLVIICKFPRGRLRLGVRGPVSCARGRPSLGLISETWSSRTVAGGSCLA